MSAFATPTPAIARARSGRRWLAPIALVVVEYLALSLLVDFPTSGPAMPLVSAARMLVPVVIGGGAAGWLVARRALRPSSEPTIATPRPWGPWLALALHLAAFTATAVLALRWFGGRSPVGPAEFVLWVACAAATGLLALAVAAPPGVLYGVFADHLRVPLVAAGIGLLTWRAVAAAEGLWGIFRAGTLRAVAAVLGTVSAGVVVDPARSLIGANGFEVIVAPICSGVDGLGLVVVFQSVWLSFARSRVHLGRSLALVLPLGAAMALAANVLRISVLVLVGAAGREDLAMSAFHSKLGWLLFVAIAFASVAAAERLEWLRRRDVAPGEDVGVPRSAAPHLAPLVVALAVALVTSLGAAGGIDRLYALRGVAAVAVLLAVRRSLPAPRPSFSRAAVLVGAATGAVWIAWTSGGETALPAALASLGEAERAAWIGGRALVSCLVLPVVEELAFRGFLLPWLVASDVESVSPRAWTWPAVLLSSLAFGAIHGDWLLGFLGGLAFAAVRLHRGRLADAILAHATANVVVAAGVLLGGRWAPWS